MRKQDTMVSDSASRHISRRSIAGRLAFSGVGAAAVILAIGVSMLSGDEGAGTLAAPPAPGPARSGLEPIAADADKGAAELPPAGPADGGVTADMRGQAEAWWRMMYNMQGIPAQDSPHLSSLIRKGTPAASCDAGCDHLDHEAITRYGPKADAGGQDADAAGTEVAVWDKSYFRHVQNRLGLPPFEGDYEDYLARMEARKRGDDSCCSPDQLKLASAETVGPALRFDDPMLLTAPGPVMRILPPAPDPGSVGPDDHPGSMSLVTPSPGSTVRHYRVKAFETDIIYNKYGDHDPQGMMYALEQDVARFQAAVAKGFNAGHDPIAYGIQSDPTALAPTPLVLRANVGDTVVIDFVNGLSGSDRASIYIHKGVYVAGSNGSMTGFNPDGTIAPGERITYTWKIPDKVTAEGTYYFYSHADPRYQIAHGLFGALVVEPKGAVWLDNYTGELMGTRSDGGPTNWGAMISFARAAGTQAELTAGPSGGGPAGPGPVAGGSVTGPSVGAGSISAPPGGMPADFREYVVMYHDRVRLVDTAGNPLIDTHGLVPNPGGKAFSYRSEPFFNMLDQVGDVNREPLAYSGYTMGDSSTPHPRWYVGDPTSFKILHAGGGEHHVHHNHINRWRRDPHVEAGQNLTQASKHDEFDVSNAISNRVDSQIMGPGETFNFRLEGGAGSVERSVGDILFHCHFIEHVVEGMWSYHRVYNTLQAEPADTNSGTTPGGPLAELPDRAGDLLPGVDSVALRGMLPFRPAAGLHKGELIDTDAKLSGFIEDQLPAPGVTGFDDATKWDWISITDPGGSGGQLYLGEPLGPVFGPGFPAAGEGEGSIAQNRTVTVGLDERPVLKFNPKVLGTSGGVPVVDGRLAFPHLKPVLDKRPPFAPFGPTDPRFDNTLDDLASGLYPASTPPLTQGTPYMGPLLAPTDAGFPSGLDQGGGLAPNDAPVRRFNIEAITLPIQYNAFGDNDPTGEIFVLSEEKADILAGIKPAQPLVLRVNEGDRVEYVITNSIPDNPSDTISKSTIGIHSHLVQYDVQGSDGAVAGLNYETGMQFGESVFESFYADVELGTVYQHDHQILLQSLPRGLFMALIVEPGGSTYHDPVTGSQILSGTMADVRTNGGTDGFRDFAVIFNDSTQLMSAKATFTPQSHNTSTSDPEKGFSSLNLRAEPIVNRADPGTPDVPFVYSSTMFGDPSTDLWQAYVGDPVRLRVESGGANRAHALQTPGHRFRHEQFNPNTDLRDFWFMGPSTTRDFELEPGAGGALGKAGDYFYYDGDMDHREEGEWGIFRVFNTINASLLKPLPGHAPPPLGAGELPYAPGGQVVTGSPPAPAADPPAAPWPVGANVRTYEVVAVEGSVNYTPGFTDSKDAFARVFLLADDLPAFQAGTFNPEPLVMRANAGEGIEVHLTNLLADDDVGMLPSLVGLDPRDSYGASAGFNAAQTAAPGGTRTYRWYADTELGTCMVSDPVNLADNATHGLWAALIVEPADSTWFDSKTGMQLNTRPDGGPPASQAIIRSDLATFESFREGTIFFHDNVTAFQYEVAINYRIGRRVSPDDPLGGSLPTTGGPHDDGELKDPDEEIEHSSVIYGDPPLVLEAHLGDPYRLRVLQPAFHDHHAISVHGHQFTINMNSPNSREISIKSLTTGSAHNFSMTAGGPEGSEHAGDFLFHCHIMDHKKVGMWGLFRVHPVGSTAIAPIP